MVEAVDHLWFLSTSTIDICIVVSCEHGTQDVCTVKEVRKYHSMCETVESVHTAVETQRRIFVEYQDIPLAKPTDGLMYGKISVG
jgi:hypothetical protein